RVLGGVLHLHVVARHREGHVYRVQEERVNESGGGGQVSEFDPRRQWDEAGGGSGKGFSGKTVFVSGLRGLVEWEVSAWLVGAKVDHHPRIRMDRRRYALIG